MDLLFEDEEVTQGGRQKGAPPHVCVSVFARFCDVAKGTGGHGTAIRIEWISSNLTERWLAADPELAKRRGGDKSAQCQCYIDRADKNEKR